MDEKTLWEQDDVSGAKVFFVLAKDSQLTPEYALVVDSANPEYMANELRVALQRAHLADLWLAILEQADDLTWASMALVKEAAIRSVMKVRQCSREDAAKLIKGERL